MQREPEAICEHVLEHLLKSGRFAVNELPLRITGSACRNYGFDVVCDRLQPVRPSCQESLFGRKPAVLAVSQRDEAVERHVCRHESAGIHLGNADARRGPCRSAASLARSATAAPAARDTRADSDRNDLESLRRL